SAAIEQNASALSGAQNLRDQLKPLRQQASDRTQAQNIVNTIDALDRKIVSLAGSEQRRSDQTEAVPNPTLTRINGTLATLLTVVDSADALPSTQAMQEFDEIQKTLDQLLAAWQQIQQKELAQLNQLLRRAGFAAISIKNASQTELPNAG